MAKPCGGALPSRRKGGLDANRLPLQSQSGSSAPRGLANQHNRRWRKPPTAADAQSGRRFCHGSHFAANPASARRTREPRNHRRGPRYSKLVSERHSHGLARRAQAFHVKRLRQTARTKRNASASPRHRRERAQMAGGAWGEPRRPNKHARTNVSHETLRGTPRFGAGSRLQLHVE